MSGLDGLKPPAVVGCEVVGLDSSEGEGIRDMEIAAEISAEIAAQLAVDS